MGLLSEVGLRAWGGGCWEGEGDGQPEQVRSGSIQEGDRTCRVRRASWLGVRGGSSGGQGIRALVGFGGHLCGVGQLGTECQSPSVEKCSLLPWQ